MIKNFICFCFIVIPCFTLANDIDKVIVDIKQIIAEKRKIDIENILIIKPDNRLKLSRCGEDLSVTFPFKSHKTILVECKKPNWKFYTSFKSKKKYVYFKFKRKLKIGDLLTIEDIKKYEGNVNLNNLEKNLSFEKIIGTRLVKDVEVNQIVGKNLFDNISFVIKTFKNIKKNEFINKKNSLVIPLESEKVPFDAFILKSKDFAKGLIVDSDIPQNSLIKNSHILSKIKVLVSRRFLKSGAQINTDNFEFKTLNKDSVGKHYIDSFDGLKFNVVNRTFSKGEVLTKSDTRSDKIILKNQIVTYILSTKNGVRIAASAKALENGTFGQKIKLKNTDSGREIYGYVYNSKIVKNK
jgi:flagella basal body P-ring formation protein FlgA